MAASNFKDALRFTLKYEGGYVDHPADPGGATNLGITIAVLRSWRGRPVTKDDVRNLKVDEAGQIYKARYWDKVEGDKLPPGVDLAVFDYAVNSGPARAAKVLQRAAGVPADGVIGMDTIAAVHARTPREMIAAVCDERLRFVKSLKTWATFGKGWAARIAAVRAASIRMASGYKAGEFDATPAKEKAKSKDVSATRDPINVGSAAAGAGGAMAPTIEAIKKANEAAEAGKGIVDFVASVGPWVVLAIVSAGAAWYIIRLRKKMKIEGDI